MSENEHKSIVKEIEGNITNQIKLRFAIQKSKGYAITKVRILFLKRI